VSEHFRWREIKHYSIFILGHEIHIIYMEHSMEFSVVERNLGHRRNLGEKTSQFEGPVVLI